MNSIGPKLPLMRDTTYGFFLPVQTYAEEIQQNLKNLLLTGPGERMMNPDFGVGLRHFLFEPKQHSVSLIRQKIDEQMKRYMPFIRAYSVRFDTGTNPGQLDDSNILSMTITYDVPSLNLSSELLLSREDIN